MATDLDSRNGTALNGEPLDRPRRLRDGDTLMIGGHRLEVSDPVPGRAGQTVAAAAPAVALSEEERATATALVAPYRTEGAFAGRPATRAEIAEALHVSERTAQRRLDALAAKLEISGEAVATGRARSPPGSSSSASTAPGSSRCVFAPYSGVKTHLVSRTGPNAARSGARLSLARTRPRPTIGGQMQITSKGTPMLNRTAILMLLTHLRPGSAGRRLGGGRLRRRGRLLAGRHDPALRRRRTSRTKASTSKAGSSPPATAASTS